MTQPLLEIIAQAMALPDGCCSLKDEDGSCCMTDRAKLVLGEIALHGGPTLDEMEAIRAARESK